MRIQWKDKFKEDYQKLLTGMKNSSSLKKAFSRAISIIQLEKDLSRKFTVNRLVAKGQGWYACYLLEDIIMIYKIEGQYVKLSRIGTAKQLRKEK